MFKGELARAFVLSLSMPDVQMWGPVRYICEASGVLAILSFFFTVSFCGCSDGQWCRKDVHKYQKIAIFHSVGPKDLWISVHPISL